MSRFVLAVTLLLAAPVGAQASCAEAAARLAANGNVRVVAVRETARACRIRVIEQRRGKRPRSRVVVVRR